MVEIKTSANDRPKLAVWKFASCDGCQLTLLDCEDELLTIANEYQICHFTEMTSENIAGPYMVSLVEGSIFTNKDLEHIQHVRKNSKYVVALGACATSGGIQALKNFRDDPNYISVVYAKPQYIDSIKESKAVSACIKVDFELRGCPINKVQLLEVLVSFLNNCRPRLPNESVCMQCKRAMIPCVMVTQNKSCLGPVTQAGCGALCPSYNRECYGCYGPKENPNTEAIAAHFASLGKSDKEIMRIFSNFNVGAQEFLAESKRHDKKDT